MHATCSFILLLAGRAWWMLATAVLLAVVPPGVGLAGEPAVEPAQPAAERSAQEGILLNFRDVPLPVVLEHLSEEAGLIVVEEAAVQGRVTVMSRQPLSVPEAVSLLNTVLAESGYAALRTGRVLRIVALEEAKRRNVPVHSGSDPDAIAPTDDVITQIIPLKFADATQVREDLASLVPGYADFTANASSNALILTDTGANVRRIVEIVRALDTHMATVAEVRVFALTYANATDAARLINALFEETEGVRTQRGDNPFTRMRQFFRGPGGSGGDDEQAVSRAPQVVAAADERTNTVVVSGPSDTLSVVEAVLQQLDANPVEEEAVLVFSLRNATATNVAEVLNNLFGAAEEGSRALRTTGQQGGERQGPFARMAQQASAAVEATGGLAGGVYAVADEDTNSLLVLTAPTNLERLHAILNELDRPIPQVLIKVLLAEVTWSDTDDIGVEFSVLDTEADGDQVNLFSDFGVEDAEGGFIYRMVQGDVTLTLRLLEELGKLDILSRPHILASDNQTARITVGQEVPFITNTRTTETGQTINTIQYEDIGIILEVTPHMNPEGLVIMDVYPEISAITGDTVPISETVQAAVFAKRSAQTRIAIRDGQTIVIGGLIEDRKTDTVRQVPILGRIPLLGALFRRTISTKEKTELLIFLTPHVAQEAGLLEAMSADELDGAEQLKGAVSPGRFDSHLQGMKRGAAPPPEAETP